jgi:hypothetical protein
LFKVPFNNELHGKQKKKARLKLKQGLHDDGNSADLINEA